MLLAAMVICVVSAAEKKSCCAQTATEEFAAFGKEMAFVALHEAPLPFVFETTGGEMKTIKTSDGVDANIYEVKSSKISNNYIFIFHEWWGLNDYIKQEAEKWQHGIKNVNVIALDLYDGKIAQVPDSAKAYVGAVKEERARVIIKAAMEYAGEKAKIATLGWCFGGGWSMQAALMLGKQAVGCVIYYGMPEKDPKKLSTLNCDVLGIFGTQDAYINPQVVADFQKNMKEAKKTVTVKNFDAVHAFANPSNPKHDKEKTAVANEAALKYLKSKLKP